MMLEMSESEIKNISELTELLRGIFSSHQEKTRRLWFRGHSKKTYALQPHLVRIASENGTATPEKIAHLEQYALRRFKQLAPAVMGGKTVTQDGEWLFLMQHYELPTRLLDWSESPLVALYFAVRSSTKRVDAARSEDEDGDLWVLDPIALNMLMLSESDEARALIDLANESDELVKPLVPEGFSKSGKHNVVALIAQRSDPRIIAQQGVFTLHGKPQTLDGEIIEICITKKIKEIESKRARERDDADEDDGGRTVDEVLSEREREDINEECERVKNEMLWRIRIPTSAKESIAEELAMLGIHQASVFPELRTVAKFVKNEVVERAKSYGS